MSKIVVIDVNLGETVDDIIGRATSAISQRTHDAIKKVVEEQKQEENIKNIAQAAKTQKEDNITKAIAVAFDLIVSEMAKGRMVGAPKILAIMPPDIPNLISFVGRMRAYLRNGGNIYRLVSGKRGKETQYSFEPFNKED